MSHLSAVRVLISLPWSFTALQLIFFVGLTVNRAAAQVCPSPIVVNNTACTVAPGTIVTVSPANAIGQNASGPLGQITANGITDNLGAATTTGALAQTGATIFFNGSTLTTTATTTATSAGQTGLRSTGTGSTINATGSSVTIGPPNGTTTANNMVGATAENAGGLNLTNTTIRMLGGGNGLNDHGLLATGVNSFINFSGGSISTISRNSIGAWANSGGIISLTNGAQITTTGVLSAGVSPFGSHALLATGAGSQVSGTNIAVNVSGISASGARAESSGAISLTGSTITSSSTSAADTDPSSGARALSGGLLTLNGVTINATGQRGDGFSVQDAGSQATVSNSAITVNGNRAPAAFIFSGGQATVTGSSLLSVNNTGVLVQDAGSTISLVDSSIRSQGAVGYGLRAASGGAATISGGSVTTEGRDGPALYAANGTIIATNVVLATSGPDNAMGALADTNGRITLNGGSVTTSGDNVRLSAFPHGLAARNPGGTLISTGTTVLTTGLVAMGAVADDGGTVILNGNSITTRGAGSVGLYATVEQSGTQFPASLTGNGITVETFGLGAPGATSVEHFLIAPSVITLNDSSVTTHGDLSGGLRAIMAGNVNANRTVVLTEGTASDGVHARDNGSVINLDASSVLSIGANSHGAVANSGGLVTALNSTVRATGANGSALYVAGAPGFVSEARFTASSLTNVSGPTIGVGGNGNVSLTNSFASGSGQWLRVGTIGEFPPLTLPDAGPLGITDPEGTETPIVFAPPAALPVVPGLANVTLSGSTVVGSAFTAPGSVSNVVLTNDSLWIMTGSSNVTNLTNDPSLIQFTPPTGDPTQLASYKTLTVQNYMGLGGALGLNTYLGTDGSPSDRLVINGGTATGNSPLRIANTTGAGALTNGNGILVVDTTNGGTTAGGAFSLGNRVIAGPYEYGLFRSSVDTSNLQAWYLRSTLDCTLAPNASVCPTPPVPGPNPIPNYRAETSLYAALPSMVLLYGRNLMDTLHERVGEERPGIAPPDGNSVQASLGWARMIALNGNQGGSPEGIFGSGPKYDYNLYAFQGGVDLYRGERADGGSDHAGIYTAIGAISADVTHFTGLSAGTNNINAYTLGGYWTRFGAPGWYVDTIAQVTWYDAKALPFGVTGLTTSGPGFAASVETGQPFQLGGGYLIEPQAQLVFQTATLSGTSDSAASIVFHEVDSLAGRIGARLARSFAIDPAEQQPRLITAWLRPSVWYEFLGNPLTSFSSATGYIPFRADLGGGWGEVTAGLDIQVTRAASLYANGIYQIAFDGRSDAFGGKFGARLTW
jgi:autotransporter family porin